MPMYNTTDEVTANAQSKVMKPLSLRIHNKLCPTNVTQNRRCPSQCTMKTEHDPVNVESKQKIPLVMHNQHLPCCQGSHKADDTQTASLHTKSLRRLHILERIPGRRCDGVRRIWDRIFLRTVALEGNERNSREMQGPILEHFKIKMYTP